VNYSEGAELYTPIKTKTDRKSKRIIIISSNNNKANKKKNDFDYHHQRFYRYRNREERKQQFSFQVPSAVAEHYCGPGLSVRQQQQIQKHQQSNQPEGEEN